MIGTSKVPITVYGEGGANFSISWSYQFISFSALWLAHGCRQSKTTTLSALAGIKPSKNTFRHPQL